MVEEGLVHSGRYFKRSTPGATSCSRKGSVRGRHITGAQAAAASSIRLPSFLTSTTLTVGPGKLSQLTSKMSSLQSTWRHSPRDPNLRQSFLDAQLEMWVLAQAICSLLNPELQWEIDITRAYIVTQLKDAAFQPTSGSVFANSTNGGFVMKRSTRKKARPLLWQDIEITPEISCDPTLTGSAAVAADVVKLRRLLRDQRVLVSQCLTHSASPASTLLT
jgi:hypothetical protein